MSEVQKRALTAEFVEDSPLVSVTLSAPNTNPQRQAVPLQVFMESFQSWMKVEEEGAEVVADPTIRRIQTALHQPEKWQVNALATPMHYALLVDGEWRIAVGLRPVVSIMTLKFRFNDDSVRDPGIALNFAVPPRVIAGVWKGPALISGIVGLCPTAAAAPIAPNDDLHLIYPWVWGNVTEMGQVCFGTTTRPKWGQDGVTTIERGFFDSLFNEDLTRYRAEAGEVEDDDDIERTFNLLSWHEEQVGSHDEVVSLPIGGGHRALPAILAHAITHPW